MGKAALIQIVIFGILFVGCLFAFGIGVSYVASSVGLEEGKCFVYARETEDCKVTQTEWTYFATSEYCGLNVTLEMDPDEVDCGEDIKAIDQTYDCYFDENGCEDGIFSFESPTDRRVQGLFLVGFSIPFGCLFCAVVAFSVVGYKKNQSFIEVVCVCCQ